MEWRTYLSESAEETERLVEELRRRGYYVEQYGTLIAWIDRDPELDRLDRLRKNLISFAASLAEDIALELGGAPVQFRIKSLFSLSEKLRKVRSLEGVKDLIGVRIVVGDADVDHAKERVIEVLKTHGCRVFEDRDYFASPQEGYRAIHIHARCPVGNVEVQIHTPPTKLFSEIAHPFYKGQRFKYLPTGMMEALRTAHEKLQEEVERYYRRSSAGRGGLRTRTVS